MIEALYARYTTAFRRVFDTEDDAGAFLEAQSDLGELYAFGIFVDSEPTRNYGVEIYNSRNREIVDHEWSVPTEGEVVELKAIYAESQEGTI